MVGSPPRSSLAMSGGGGSSGGGGGGGGGGDALLASGDGLLVPTSKFQLGDESTSSEGDDAFPSLLTSGR